MPQKSKTIKFVVIIPAFNEEQFIGLCLDSLLNQVLQPSKIVVVDDSSTDNTLQIVKRYALENSIVEVISSTSEGIHQPGAKVIRAFNRGLNTISINDYDVICKFDADLEFPTDYLGSLNKTFTNNAEIGLCGGFCSVLKNGEWQIERLTNTDHVRGALKAYRVKAFNEIDGLAEQMGWDTADEFKLRFRKWKIKTLEDLKVKHFKGTGVKYSKNYYKRQGEVFYALRYGILLCLIAALKISFNKGNAVEAFKILKSYLGSARRNVNYLLTKEEGKFLRTYRFNKIKEKF